MIVSFIYPSTHERAGGVTMFYEFGNALARRGHDVHFVHAPRLPNRVDRVEQIPFQFDEAVHHHIVDDYMDPALPDGDIIFGPGRPSQGHAAVIVQGFRLLHPGLDADAFRKKCPKICVAGWLVDVGRSFGVPEEQLVHIPMGLDHDLFAARVPLDQRPIDLAVLYHPFKQKGWGVAHEVLQRLSDSRPGFRAVVFSMTGPPRDSLPHGVDLVLDLDQGQLADQVLNQTKALLQASHHEGFGLTAIEAMACGAALVTTDCGGSRDYAIDGETALVTLGGDVEGLLARILAVLDDDALRARLARGGMDHVRSFDWARSGELLEGFLEQYLKDPAAYQRAPGTDQSAGYVL